MRKEEKEKKTDAYYFVFRYHAYKYFEWQKKKKNDDMYTFTLINILPNVCFLYFCIQFYKRI